MKTFLFSYWYQGSKYSFEMPAENSDEAVRRLQRLPGAKLDGELKVKIKVPGGGVLSRLGGWLGLHLTHR